MRATSSPSLSYLPSFRCLPFLRMRASPEPLFCRVSLLSTCKVVINKCISDTHYCSLQPCMPSLLGVLIGTCPCLRSCNDPWYALTTPALTPLDLDLTSTPLALFVLASFFYMSEYISMYIFCYLPCPCFLLTRPLPCLLLVCSLPCLLLVTVLRLPPPCH